MDGKTYIRLPHIKEEIKSRFNYNPETGELTWAYRDENNKQNIYFNKHFAGKVAGKVYEQPYGYKINMLKLELFGKRVTLVVSRLCWLVQTGDWPKHTIDHINKDPLDNRWVNLRDVPQKINNQNKSKKYKKLVDESVSM